MRANRIDLSQVPGSCEGGRVTRRDALSLIEDHHMSRLLVGNALPDQRLASTGGDEHVPRSRVRRSVAEMTLAKTTTPHAWQAQQGEMKGAVANRDANIQQFQQREGFSLTFLPYVVAAAVAGLRRHRSVNAAFTPDYLVLHRAINIGIPIGLEDGVVVAVIRNPDYLSTAGLARATNDLAMRARLTFVSEIGEPVSAADGSGGPLVLSMPGRISRRVERRPGSDRR